MPSITVPGAADNVVICSGRIVDMTGSPGACLSLTINGTAHWVTAATTNIGAGGLTLNNGAQISGVTTGSLIVAGPMNVPAGASVTVGRVILNVSGLTSISGSFNDNNTGGSNTFANVSLNLGGSFNNTSAETYTITGNLDTYGGDFFATGATPIFNATPACNVKKEVAVRKAKSGKVKVPFTYTSTVAAAGSAALCITCSCAVWL